MRRLVNQFAKICSETLPIIEPIYEFGSLVVEERQAEILNIRPLFPGKQFIGTDMQEGPGVDKVLNLHHIDLPDETVGTAVLLDTLEHVEDPRLAMKEIHRVLKPGGTVFISSVMDFPIHGYPNDYWRFTPEAFKSILNPFDIVDVHYAGKDIYPHTVVGIGFKKPEQSIDLTEFNERMKVWSHYWKSPLGNNWSKYVVPIVPKPLRPLGLAVYDMITGKKK